MRTVANRRPYLPPPLDVARTKDSNNSQQTAREILVCPRMFLECKIPIIQPILQAKYWMLLRLKMPIFQTKPKEFVCLLLFYAILTVFQLYHGSDMIRDEKEKAQTYTFTDSRDL